MKTSKPDLEREQEDQVREQANKESKREREQENQT